MNFYLRVDTSTEIWFHFNQLQTQRGYLYIYENLIN